MDAQGRIVDRGDADRTEPPDQPRVGGPLEGWDEPPEREYHRQATERQDRSEENDERPAQRGPLRPREGHPEEHEDRNRKQSLDDVGSVLLFGFKIAVLEGIEPEAGGKHGEDAVAADEMDAPNTSKPRPIVTVNSGVSLM